MAKRQLSQVSPATSAVLVLLLVGAACATVEGRQLHGRRGASLGGVGVARRLLQDQPQATDVTPTGSGDPSVVVVSPTPDQGGPAAGTTGTDGLQSGDSAGPAGTPVDSPVVTSSSSDDTASVNTVGDAGNGAADDVPTTSTDAPAAGTSTASANVTEQPVATDSPAPTDAPANSPAANSTTGDSTVNTSTTDVLPAAVDSAGGDNVTDVPPVGDSPPAGNASDVPAGSSAASNNTPAATPDSTLRYALVLPTPLVDSVFAPGAADGVPSADAFGAAQALGQGLVGVAGPAVGSRLLPSALSIVLLAVGNGSATVASVAIPRTAIPEGTADNLTAALVGASPAQLWGQAAAVYAAQPCDQACLAAGWQQPIGAQLTQESAQQLVEAGKPQPSAEPLPSAVRDSPALDSPALDSPAPDSPTLDGSPNHDASPNPDASPSLDVSPNPDASPSPDVSPSPDAAPLPDATPDQPPTDQPAGGDQPADATAIPPPGDAQIDPTKLAADTPTGDGADGATRAAAGAVVQPTASPASSGLSGGAIAGVVVAVLLGVVGLAAIGLATYRRHRRRHFAWDRRGADRFLDDSERIETRELEFTDMSVDASRYR